MEIPSLTSVFHRDAYPAISPSRPELSVAGKTVLITGGGRGIGKSITTAFAHAGASHIVILGRDASTLEAVKAEIEGKQDNKSKVHVFPAEISNESRMNEVFDTVVKTIGKIDVCVANAAYLNAPASVPTVSIEDFWRCFEVNVKGLLITTQAFLRSASDASVFINITSGAGQLRYFGPMSAYASSKAAGMRLMDYLTMDCPNVRVYSLQPGIIDTDMARKASAGSAKFTELDTRMLTLPNSSRQDCSCR